MSGARSQNGCHTCRLRKKKCDELHPACANCISRSIPCYGYGEMPPWMDGAGLEKEQVEKIKRAAERNYKAKRRGWRPSIEGSQGLNKKMMGELGGANQGKSLAGNFTLFGNLGTNQGVVFEENEVQDIHMSDLNMDSTGRGPWSLRRNEPEDEAISFENLSFSQAHPRSKSGPIRHYQERFTTQTTSEIYPTTTPASQAIIARHSPPSPRTISGIGWHADFANIYNVRNKYELNLLTHYLDNVFCLQFGFKCFKQSSMAPDRGRGWYLETLLRCRPLYFASLSLSSYHQWLVRQGGLEIAWRVSETASPGKETVREKGKTSKKSKTCKSGLNWEAEKSFAMTLKGLQAVINELQGQELKGVELLRARWQVLGTMCQLISLEIFRTLGGNWLLHVQAARNFLSMIGSSSFPFYESISRGSAAYGPEPPPRLDILEDIFKDDRRQILSGNDTVALKHFVTSFTWVDILSRASGIHPTHPQPLTMNPFDYLSLLENHTLDLSTVMGCENWVFIGLARIVLLESGMRAKRRSSDVSTVGDTAVVDQEGDPFSLGWYAQAALLEVVFERGIRSVLDARKGLTPETSTELDIPSSLVTELFALAALTYLHVVMSGAWPWLPAIRETVARSLEALLALPEECLIRVSWPFAVTACMALEEQWDVVTGLVARPAAKGINTGTVWKGMLVAEECWRLRAGRVSSEVSWVEAMESLGEKILFV